MGMSHFRPDHNPDQQIGGQRFIRAYEGERVSETSAFAD